MEWPHIKVNQVVQEDQEEMIQAGHRVSSLTLHQDNPQEEAQPEDLQDQDTHLQDMVDLAQWEDLAPTEDLLQVECPQVWIHNKGHLVQVIYSEVTTIP